MKNPLRTTIAAFAIITCLGAASGDAATITWDDGAGDDYWSSPTNWVGDVAPTNGDSVVLTATLQSRLDYAWTIQNGQSLTTTAPGTGDELALQSGGILTLATGGTMDIGFMRPRYSSGGQFTIEPGASLNTDAYGLGSTAATITFVADAQGVTTWTNTGQFQMGADNLVADLTSYDLANGTDLVLVDYATTNDFAGQTFASVTVTGGKTGRLVYDYDSDPTSATNLAIALTDLRALVLWDNGGVGSDFANPTNWVGDVAPVSGSDSVVLDNSKGVAALTTDFTIGAGQTMTAQNSPANDLVLSIGNGGNLIVGAGGSLDLLAGGQQGTINEGGGGETFTVEAGATVRMYRYWNDEVSYINRFIADANGVTTVEIENNFALRGTGSVLDVDLTEYDISNGDTLVLFDYGNLLLQNQAVPGEGFGTVKLTTGWTADLVLDYDQGGGDLSIALTNIVELPKGMVFTIR